MFLLGKVDGFYHHKIVPINGVGNFTVFDSTTGVFLLFLTSTLELSFVFGSICGIVQGGLERIRRLGRVPLNRFVVC